MSSSFLFFIIAHFKIKSHHAQISSPNHHQSELHTSQIFTISMHVTYIYSFYSAIFKHTLNIYLFNIWIAINVQNCRVDAALIAALMCTIHCWLIFCISPHPGTMGPPQTIGRAKHDDNAMRSALVSIRSDGSDLQLLPSLAICPDQFIAAILQWAAAAAPTLVYFVICGNQRYQVYIQQVVSDVDGLQYVLVSFQIRILNLHFFILQ